MKCFGCISIIILERSQIFFSSKYSKSQKITNPFKNKRKSDHQPCQSTNRVQNSEWIPNSVASGIYTRSLNTEHFHKIRLLNYFKISFRIHFEFIFFSFLLSLYLSIDNISFMSPTWALIHIYEADFFSISINIFFQNHMKRNGFGFYDSIWCWCICVHWKYSQNVYSFYLKTEKRVLHRK